MRLLFITAFISIFGLNSFAATPEISFEKRKDVQQFISQMVSKHKFDKAQLDKSFSKVSPRSKIIHSISNPYEKKNWDAYKQLFLTQKRVSSGIEFWNENKESLALAEKKYGVPANIIVAIIGVETLYGKNQGSHKVIDALSTLAFDYPKRAAFFKKELKEYLILCKEHGVDPHQYLGSYAGAMGKPQFMPSSYRAYAASLKKTGPKIDLMNDNQAVIASVANYFKKHGWKKNQDVAYPANVKGKAYKKFKTNTRKPSYQLTQLKNAGITPLMASQGPSKKVGLIELDTDKGLEFWLAYPNFYVITRYNTSPQYALAVYLLAQQLKNQWASVEKSHPYAYA